MNRVKALLKETIKGLASEIGTSNDLADMFARSPKGGDESDALLVLRDSLIEKYDENTANAMIVQRAMNKAGINTDKGTWPFPKGSAFNITDYNQTLSDEDLLEKVKETVRILDPFNARLKVEPERGSISGMKLFVTCDGFDFEITDLRSVFVHTAAHRLS